MNTIFRSENDYDSNKSNADDDVSGSYVAIVTSTPTTPK